MAKRSFSVDAGLRSLGNSLVEGTTVIQGDIILGEGARIIGDVTASTETKLAFADILDMNSNNIKNVAYPEHPYDLANADFVNDVIQSGITDISSIQYNRLVSLNSLLDDPSTLAFVNSYVDDKISYADFTTRLAQAKIVIEQSIQDAIQLQFDEVEETALVEALAASQHEWDILENKVGEVANITIHHFDVLQSKIGTLNTAITQLTQDLSASYGNVRAAGIAEADTRIDLVKGAVSTLYDTLPEVREYAASTANAITSEYQVKINSKTSTSYAQAALDSKINKGLGVTWSTEITETPTIDEPLTLFHAGTIQAERFVGDGSQLTGLAAGGLFQTAWDNITYLRERVDYLRELVGIPLTFTGATLVRRLHNPSSNAQSNFGNAVDAASQLVAIGAENHAETGANYSGRAYVMDKTTGAETIFINPTPSSDDVFGNAVAITSDGAYMVVGSIGKDDSFVDSGKAYIYDTSTGGLLVTLDNPNPDTNTKFGYSVACSGDRLAVGAINADIVGDTTTAIDAGAVYIYDLTPGPDFGTLLRTIENPIPSDNERFGTSVSMYNHKLAIGAPGDQNNAGVVFYYDLDNGTGLPTYIINNPYTDDDDKLIDNFGESVSLFASTLAVGAPGTTGVDGANSGKVYIFSTDTSALRVSINNPNPVGTGQDDVFGKSVSVSNNLLVVGAPYEDSATLNNTGAVYVFNALTGSIITTIENPDANSGSFGYSVSVHGTSVVVGAPTTSSDTTTDNGKVYVFNMA